MADKDAYEEWEVGALYEIAVAAAVVTVTASCKIIAAKKRRMIWVRFALPHINLLIVRKLVCHIHSGHIAQRH